MRYWDNISQIDAKQTEKGIKEYGQTLEDNKSPEFSERINYIQEELVDALKYLEWLKDCDSSVKGNALELNYIYQKGKEDAFEEVLAAYRSMGSASEFENYLYSKYRM